MRQDVISVPRMMAWKAGILRVKKIHQQCQADHRKTVGHENEFDVRVGVDVLVDVTGQADVLLPEHNPVAGE